MLQPDLCQTIEGAVCVNNPGSYSCKCSADNHVIQGDKCVEKPADPPQENKGMMQNSVHKLNASFDNESQFGSEPNNKMWLNHFILLVPDQKHRGSCLSEAYFCLEKITGQATPIFKPPLPTSLGL